MKYVILTLLLALMSASGLQAQNGVPEAPYGLSAAEVYAIFQSEYTNVMRANNTRRTIDDFELLLMYGHWIIVAHPKSLKVGSQEIRGDRNFDRMINIYNEMARLTPDPVRRSVFLDSSMTYYKRVLTIFTPQEIDEFRWRYEYGRFLLANSSIANNQALAAEQYMILFGKDPARVSKDADGFYVQFLANNMMNENRTDELTVFMDQAQPHADPATIEVFKGIRDRLFRNPEDRIVYLEDLLSKNPGNLDLMGQLYDLYVRTNNRDKSRAMARALYAAQPNFLNTRRMVQIAVGDASYREAIRLGEEALGKSTDPSELRTVALDISDAHRNMDNLRQSRDFARRANELDPSWGAPHLAMAQIYAQAVTQCAGGQLTRLDKVVYWLVLDYLDKARTDQSVRAAVDRSYAQYERSAPSVEEKFYQGWNTGDRIQVNSSLNACYAWINETTRVR